MAPATSSYLDRVRTSDQFSGRLTYLIKILIHWVSRDIFDTVLWDTLVNEVSTWSLTWNIWTLPEIKLKRGFNVVSKVNWWFVVDLRTSLNILAAVIPLFSLSLFITSSNTPNIFSYCEKLLNVKTILESSSKIRVLVWFSGLSWKAGGPFRISM